MFKLIALAVVGLLWFAWLFAKLRECEGEPLKIVLNQFSRLGWFNKTMILFFVIQLTMFGGAKHGTNDVDGVSGTNGVDVVEGGTNGVTQVEGPGMDDGTGDDPSGSVPDGDPDGGPTNPPPPMLAMPLGIGGGSLPPASRLTPDDFANGYVLHRIGTNETFFYTAPSGAAFATNWYLRGAADDYCRISPDRWRFPFRDLAVSNAVVFANGGVRFAPDAALPSFFDALGVVPRANWHLLPANCNAFFRLLGASASGTVSCFWWSRPDADRQLFTWQNALLDRCATNPVSYQVEMNRNGNFICRFDLSRIPPDHPVFGRLYAVAGVSNVTSLAYHRLTDADRDNDDRDGDGLPTEDEIFEHGTDPGLIDTDFDGYSDGEEIRRGLNPFSRDTDEDGFSDGTDPRPTIRDSQLDSDGDGFPDAWATGWFGDAPVVPHADPGGDGIDNRSALLVGVSPLASGTNGFAETSVAKPVNVNSWVISPTAFGFDRPGDVTNLIVRTFEVERTSPWQQLFVSSCPERAEGWEASDLEIAWSCGERSGTVPLSSDDSWRIPLSANDTAQTLAVRVTATGGHPALNRPLFLVRWTPRLGFSPSGNVSVFNQDRLRVAIRPDPVSGAYALPFDIATTAYPHLGGFDADVAAALALPPVAGLGMSGGRFFVTSPAVFDLPVEGLAPSVQLLFYQLIIGSSGEVASGPRASQYATPYPLNSRSLRRAYQSGDIVTTSERVTVTVLPDVPELGYVNNARLRFRGLLGASGVESPPMDIDPTVNGESCTNDPHHVEKGPDWRDREPDYSDGTMDCGCGCNRDGTQLDSFNLRVSFGEPGKDAVSGYLWTSITRPTLIRASSFAILGRESVTAATNAAGDVTIRCSDNAGRTVGVTNVANGVDVSVRLADGSLDSIWEIRNPGGDASRITARKLTHLRNATVDETYAIRQDDEGRSLWVQTDNITGVRRELTEIADPSEPAFIAEELERTYLAGRLVREESRAYERIGEARAAVRRLATATGFDERGSYAEETTYYCDARNPYRHGRRRSFRSNRKAWSWHDYDAEGRETIRYEQMNGSPFPALTAVSLDAPIPPGVSAKVTVMDYAVGADDSDDRNDVELPRLTRTFVRRNGGAATLVGRSERSCTRETDANGIPLRRTVTTEGFGGVVRSLSRVEYPDDAAVPAALRGMEVSSEEPDGSVVETEYEVSGSFVTAIARTSFGGNPRKTYSVTVYDLAFGNVVREETRLTENDEVIEWTSRSYDDRQRLRSTVYSDGTSETNAYSCCRLLWTRDREGRRKLRSARTGTDSLYYADEEVWLSSMSEDGGFRVTQHFFDGLGRETNTVTFAGYSEGEATDPVAPAEWQRPVSRTTEYVDEWNCRESFTVDERGAVTEQWEYADETGADAHAETTAGDITFGETRTTLRGGRTETYRHWDDKWTRQIAATHYDGAGRRIDVRLTESSDYGTVTNSVITYDAIGRIVSSVTPAGSSVFAYDGATTRILTETVTAGDVTRVRTCLYDECGEEIGSLQDGVTHLSRITYEESSNVWWRVTAESTTSENDNQGLTGFVILTNAQTVTREQLTGLGGGLRECVMTDNMQGEKSYRTVGFNYATGVAIETTTSSASSPVVRQSVYGVETILTAEGDTFYRWHDAFGRETYSERDNGVEWHPAALREYDAVGDLIAQSVFTDLYWNSLDEYYEYDALGNRISTVRANGEEVLLSYDAQGNLVSERGATYPVRYDCDTGNRRVAMRTTRDGETWDETRWTYDPATELCTSKRRADGTTVGYTYTPDALLAMTTRSNGHWVRNVYDAARQVVGVETDDGDDVAFERDPFGRETSAANAVATYAYALDVCGVATNETAAVGGVECAIRRAVDDDGRRVALDVDGACQSVGYRADGRIAAVSNADAVVTYAYTYDEKDAGCTLSVAGGATFVRELIRDGFRRGLVTRVENGIGADFTYGFDALGRPVSRNADRFSYNAHGEVSGAWTAGNVEAYVYDNIGNLLASSANAETNRYVSNCLNQYMEINQTIEQSEQSNNPVYDAEGNLTQYGEWSYT